MSKSSKIAVNAVAALVFTAGLAGVAMADSAWDQKHPRRDEVNDRLQNQNRRIHNELKAGNITQTQAAAMHKNDQAIRQEERTMAGLDNGHITKLDQKALNQQENVASQGIAKANTAKADSTWALKHPRRDEVNDRLQNQDQRIHQEVKEGDLTTAQAAALHKDDQSIRQEERDMAHLDNGHITAVDQKALNQQENVVSKDIGQ
jgi:hypothetical protein